MYIESYQVGIKSYADNAKFKITGYQWLYPKDTNLISGMRCVESISCMVNMQQTHQSPCDLFTT